MRDKPYIEHFAEILWAYDLKHQLKQQKNKRYYRNPNAVLHYSEALAKAQSLIVNNELDETIKALQQCFTPEFWPLKKFIKEFS